MRDELCGFLLVFAKHRNDYEWITIKFRKLFQPKETEMSALIKLFSCRQKVNHSTREFLAEIRRLGFRLLKELVKTPVKKGETRMIRAFT